MSGLKACYGVQGYRVLVQSARPPRFVEKRIEAFLSKAHVKVTLFVIIIACVKVW